jgi:histidinol-phosphatase (PHP family)
MGVYPPGYIDRYVEVAAARGVEELGFSEHLYRCTESAPVLGRWWESEPDPQRAAEMAAVVAAERNLSLESYVSVVVDAKDRGLPVKLGLEVDFQPGTEGAVIDLLAGYPFDFLIGSVHWIGGWGFDRRANRAEFSRRGVRRSYEQYFELEAALAASGMVDVLAHADVVKKTGIRPSEPIDDLYDAVAEAAANSGTAVEVSSAGLRHLAAEIFPAPAFLARLHRSGVPITLASDAHLPHEAGWGRQEAVHAARAVGYTHQLRFDRRARRSVPLPDLLEASA